MEVERLVERSFSHYQLSTEDGCDRDGLFAVSHKPSIIINAFAIFHFDSLCF